MRISKTAVAAWVTALACLYSALTVDWGNVPEGDPDLVPAGIAATLPPSTSSTVVVTTTVPATTTMLPLPSTTTTAVLAGGWQCPEQVTLAHAVGWPIAELTWLDMVMHRESRCQPWVHAGPEDGPTFSRDDSYGLLQINVKGDLWAARQAVCGLVDPAQLYDPAVNLACGLALWKHSGRAPWGG